MAPTSRLDLTLLKAALLGQDATHQIAGLAYGRVRERVEGLARLPPHGDDAEVPHDHEVLRDGPVLAKLS
jgi:hypothetical protein